MFTDLTQTLQIVKDNLRLTDTSKDAELTTILENSAGANDEGTIYYRPYLVSAYFLPILSAIQRSLLIEADGAKWLKPSDMIPLITAWLTLQESADCNLTIDPCWQTSNLRQRLLCGCEAETGEIGVSILGAMVI